MDHELSERAKSLASDMQRLEKLLMASEQNGRIPLPVREYFEVRKLLIEAEYLVVRSINLATGVEVLSEPVPHIGGK